MPICPEPGCGMEMIQRTSTMLGGDAPPYYCPATPDQHELTALKKELADLKAHPPGIGDGDIQALIEERDTLKRELEEARKTMNEMLNQYNRGWYKRITGERDAAQDLASERGAQVVLLREALDRLFNAAIGDVPSWEITKAEKALTSTADAAEAMKREILEGAAKAVWNSRIHLIDSDGPDYIEITEDEINVAILGAGEGEP